MQNVANDSKYDRSKKQWSENIFAWRKKNCGFIKWYLYFSISLSAFCISFFFLHLCFLYWQCRNWSSNDQVMTENPQIIGLKGLVPLFLFSSALFGLILKELYDRKGITAFLCLFQTFKSIKGFLILVDIFPDFKHLCSRLSWETVLYILQIFVATLCNLESS